ncbi:hypothetical protein HIM_07484 [Hirsutella minnesotensis 3608]|uniref:Alkaline ceramidase YPC1 n=1 Tax=Hirsutella minnesotensis 3608 TaxID=1043627 RepID=A0A0F7ZN43_9HYPO|nr:hypothetical protein HIM_07484 [Hirsutella minnesotensis 3608]
MSDELSMHLLTTPLLHRLLTFNSDPRRARTTGLALLALLAAVMVTHMVLDEFLLHASAFGLAVYLIGNRVLRIIPQQVPDPGVRKKVRNVAIFGYLSFGFGYLVWLMDDWLCRHLTTFRHSVGVPFAFFTELHGWWHVFTAVGGYIAVSVVDTITSGEVRDDPVESLAWPVPMAARFVSGATAAKKDEKN